MKMRTTLRPLLASASAAQCHVQLQVAHQLDLTTTSGMQHSHLSSLAAFESRHIAPERLLIKLKKALHRMTRNNALDTVRDVDEYVLRICPLCLSSKSRS